MCLVDQYVQWPVQFQHRGWPGSFLRRCMNCQFWRMYCKIISAKGGRTLQRTFDGGRMIVVVAGTLSLSVICQPARSMRTTPWAPGEMRRLISSRCIWMAWLHSFLARGEVRGRASHFRHFRTIPAFAGTSAGERGRVPQEFAHFRPIRCFRRSKAANQSTGLNCASDFVPTMRSGKLGLPNTS